MGRSALTQHALRQTIGVHASNELILLLGQLADELKAEEAHAKSKVDKTAADITKTAVKLNEVITPAAPVAPAPIAGPVPAPPDMRAVAPIPPFTTPAPA